MVPLLALGLFAVVAIVATWPLVTALATHYPVWDATVTAPAPDQLLTSWILASDARQLATDPLHPFESNNFHPFRRTLTFSENLLGMALLVLPVQYFGDNPTLTDNVAFLAALTLGGWGVFLLVRELSGSVAAGLVAGMLALSAPTHWWNLTQLHMIADYGTPLALLALTRVVRTAAWRWSILLGVVAAFQAWSSLHHGLFLALALATGVPVLLVVSRRARTAVPQLLAGGLLAAVLVLPLVLAYRATAREMDVTMRGTMIFFYWPHQLVPPFDRPLSHLGARLASGERWTEFGTLTPWLLLGAGGVALAWGRRSTMDGALLAALAVGGAANWLLALGPVRWHGLPSLYQMIATSIPGLGNLRAPARASAYAYLVLCILGGCGYAAVAQRLRRPAAHVALAVSVLGLAIVESGWRTLPLAPAPARSTAIASALADLAPGCGIAELPATLESGARALYRSTTHWRPLVNGYSGFYGIEPATSYWFLNQFPAPRALEFLWAAGACAVVVERPEHLPRVVAESRRLGLSMRAAGAATVFLLPAAPAPAAHGTMLARAGWRASEGDGDYALDDDLGTLWEGSVNKAEPDRLTIDMGQPLWVTALELELGHHLRRYLVSYRVEGSLDGANWRILAEAPVATPPLASYRTDPYRIRQRIDFAKPAEIRFQRIGPYRRPPRGGGAPDFGFETWGVAEARAVSP